MNVLSFSDLSFPYIVPLNTLHRWRVIGSIGHFSSSWFPCWARKVTCLLRLCILHGEERAVNCVINLFEAERIGQSSDPGRISPAITSNQSRDGSAETAPGVLESGLSGFYSVFLPATYTVMIQICNFIGQNKEQGEQQDALDKVKAVLFSCYKNIGVNDQDILYHIDFCYIFAELCEISKDSFVGTVRRWWSKTVTRTMTTLLYHASEQIGSNYPMNRKKGRKMVRRNDNTILYGNLACRIFQNMRE